MVDGASFARTHVSHSVTFGSPMGAEDVKRAQARDLRQPRLWVNRAFVVIGRVGAPKPDGHHGPEGRALSRGTASATSEVSRHLHPSPNLRSDRVVAS
jgi:hypothetical protein